MIDDAVEKGLGLDAFAHQPALHVREGHDERVDPAVADHGLELFETRMSRALDVLIGAHRSSRFIGGAVDRPKPADRFVDARIRGC